MNKHKRIENEYEWIPDHIRIPFPPRKPELRKALLWLCRDGQELYFVNLTNETLDSVWVGSGGFATYDDDTVPVTGKNGYEYENVKPNEAVKIDEFDYFYDCDFVIQENIKVKSEKLGCIEILSNAEKGGVSDSVLLWDSGESGKYVHISKYLAK